MKNKSIQKAVQQQLRQSQPSSNIQAPHQQMWEELDALHDSIARPIVKICLAVKAIYDNKELMKSLSDNDSNTTLIFNGFWQDADKTTELISDIQKQHDGKKGPVAKEDIDTYLQIGNSYIGLADTRTTLLSNTYQNIVTSIGNLPELNKTKEELLNDG